jgi:DNA-directed RNA polymerase specialized sigma24 family protein
MQPQSVDEEVEPWGDEDVSRILYSAAKQVRNRFYHYVEFEDLIQEAWMAVYATSKLAEWQSQGDPGRGRLRRHLLKACSLYAQKNKAARLGYRHTDLFYYSPGLLRHIVSLILDSIGDEREIYENFPDRAVWMDVESALLTLPDSDYQILWWAFKGDLDEEEGHVLVGERLGISTDAARKRVDRVLRRLQNHLGGENPSPRRKSKTNAAAMAETRNAWEGEG